MVLDGQAGWLRAANGYAMAALLVAIGVMSIMLTVAMPAWRQAAKREKEAQLIFRGEQYARAVALFQRKFAGGFPPSIDLLIEQKFLRKKYTDPMVEDGEFQVLYQTTAVGARAGRVAGGVTPGSSASTGAGQVGAPSGTPQSGVAGGSAFDTGEGGVRGGVVGVVSKSSEESLMLYDGRSQYNEWQFLFSNVTTQPGLAGAAGVQTPGFGTPGAGGAGQRAGGGLDGRPPGGGRSGLGAPPGIGSPVRRGAGIGRPPP